ncbi:MAG: hypothetical protein WCV70_00415 [Patescibacteria group bacterium]|jgi:hypothetical protein
MDDIKDKFKNKKFQANIIIYAVIFVIIILLLNWLVKSGQTSRNKNQEENFSDYYKSLLVKCDKQDEKIYNCCFASVAYMAANNLELAGIGCQPAFKLNTFGCLGSYKWCEMVR